MALLLGIEDVIHDLLDHLFRGLADERGPERVALRERELGVWIEIFTLSSSMYMVISHIQRSS
jgi:hypothetical protein